MGGVRPAASLYAAVKSVCAWSATASALCCTPFTVPGGNPVIAVPGLTPKSPLMTLGPVLVTVVPARTAKLLAVPRSTGACAALALDCRATNMATPTMHATPAAKQESTKVLRDDAPTKKVDFIWRIFLPYCETRYAHRHGRTEPVRDVPQVRQRHPRQWIKLSKTPPKS
jgi:hypothetical protein